jgi:hypothetical protein
MHAVFMAGGARLLDIATPQRRFTMMLTSVSRELAGEQLPAVFGAYLDSFDRYSMGWAEARDPRVVNCKENLGQVKVLNCRYWKFHQQGYEMGLGDIDHGSQRGTIVLARPPLDSNQLAAQRSARTISDASYPNHYGILPMNCNQYCWTDVLRNSTSRHPRNELPLDGPRKASDISHNSLSRGSEDKTMFHGKYTVTPKHLDALVTSIFPMIRSQTGSIQAPHVLTHA